MIRETMQVSDYNQEKFNELLSRFISSVNQERYHIEVQFAIAHVNGHILHTALCIVRLK